MKIIDLNIKYKIPYFCCLEEYSNEMRDSGDFKENWYNKIKSKGLRVKLALDDNNSLGGMIQYFPIEYSAAEGENIFFIGCIWVHGHKKGRGDFQKKGMGKALLVAAEKDAKKLGANGIAAWGISLPFWMKASWFKRNGYKKVDNFKGRILLFKPFTQNAISPKWLKRKKTPQLTVGKVTITVLISGWCTGLNITYKRIKQVAQMFKDQVVYNEINTFDKKIRDEWGLQSAFFINDKQIIFGAPLTKKKIIKLIKKNLKKIK